MAAIRNKIKNFRTDQKLKIYNGAPQGGKRGLHQTVAPKKEGRPSEKARRMEEDGGVNPAMCGATNRARSNGFPPSAEENPDEKTDADKNEIEDVEEKNGGFRIPAAIRKAARRLERLVQCTTPTGKFTDAIRSLTVFPLASELPVSLTRGAIHVVEHRTGAVSSLALPFTNKEIAAGRSAPKSGSNFVATVITATASNSDTVVCGDTTKSGSSNVSDVIGILGLLKNYKKVETGLNSGKDSSEKGVAGSGTSRRHGKDKLERKESGDIEISDNQGPIGQVFPEKSADKFVNRSNKLKSSASCSTLDESKLETVTTCNTKPSAGVRGRLDGIGGSDTSLALMMRNRLYGNGTVSGGLFAVHRSASVQKESYCTGRAFDTIRRFEWKCPPEGIPEKVLLSVLADCFKENASGAGKVSYQKQQPTQQKQPETPTDTMVDKTSIGKIDADYINRVVDSLGSNSETKSSPSTKVEISVDAKKSIDMSKESKTSQKESKKLKEESRESLKDLEVDEDEKVPDKIVESGGKEEKKKKRRKKSSIFRMGGTTYGTNIGMNPGPGTLTDSPWHRFKADSSTVKNNTVSLAIQDFGKQYYVQKMQKGAVRGPIGFSGGSGFGVPPTPTPLTSVSDLTLTVNDNNLLITIKDPKEVRWRATGDTGAEGTLKSDRVEKNSPVRGSGRPNIEEGKRKDNYINSLTKDDKVDEEKQSVMANNFGKQWTTKPLDNSPPSLILEMRKTSLPVRKLEPPSLGGGGDEQKEAKEKSENRKEIQKAVKVEKVSEKTVKEPKDIEKTPKVEERKTELKKEAVEKTNIVKEENKKMESVPVKNVKESEIEDRRVSTEDVLSTSESYGKILNAVQLSVGQQKVMASLKKKDESNMPSGLHRYFGRADSFRSSIVRDLAGAGKAHRWAAEKRSKLILRKVKSGVTGERKLGAIPIRKEGTVSSINLRITTTDKSFQKRASETSVAKSSTNELRPGFVDTKSEIKKAKKVEKIINLSEDVIKLKKKQHQQRDALTTRTPTRSTTLPEAFPSVKPESFAGSEASFKLKLFAYQDNLKRNVQNTRFSKVSLVSRPEKKGRALDSSPKRTRKSASLSSLGAGDKEVRKTISAFSVTRGQRSTWNLKTPAMNEDEIGMWRRLRMEREEKMRVMKNQTLETILNRNLSTKKRMELESLRRSTSLATGSKVVTQMPVTVRKLYDGIGTSPYLPVKTGGYQADKVGPGRYTIRSRIPTVKPHGVHSVTASKRMIPQSESEILGDTASYRKDSIRHFSMQKMSIEKRHSFITPVKNRHDSLFGEHRTRRNDFGWNGPVRKSGLSTASILMDYFRKDRKHKAFRKESIAIVRNAHLSISKLPKSSAGMNKRVSLKELRTTSATTRNKLKGTNARIERSFSLTRPLYVNISVEAPIENQIQEITYDGQEIYQQPLSMSESLAKLAQKIDFSKAACEDKKDPEGTDKTDEDTTQKDSSTSFQSSLWPWDSVRNKLRNALTEVCVLADVLAIAKEKRYMVLDPVQLDVVETKPMAQVYARKKALAGAAEVLLKGVERLRASQNEAARNRSTPDFHIELLRLRKNWRLKKVANTIIGDLSYRTAGSKYLPTGMFEVTKAEDEDAGKSGGTGSPPPSPGVNVSPAGAGGGTPSAPKPTSALRVTVPSELQGVAYIQVICKKDQEDLCSASLNLLGSCMPSPIPDVHWQQKLEAAQNVLFCKELFNQLAKEAVQLQAPIPHMVVGNQIMATVLPGIQLIIGLYHSTGTEGKKSSGAQTASKKSEHDHVLEHSLHQLLREVHHKNTHHPLPHPSSGPLGPSKRRCLAGPNAADRHQLLEMTKSQTLLEQIIQQAQHFFMRLRAEYVLDTIAKDVKDPLIVSHWNALNSPTQSCVKINILTHGYDTVCRTSLVVHVGEKSLKCVCRDGRVMHMSYETQELRNLIYCQIYQHQITAVQALAKCMGWQYLANSSHLGLGSVEQLGNACSCILASPIGDRLIAVRCEPQGGAQVSIAHSPRKDFFSGQLVKERKWENLGGAFKEVRWDKMEGKNFINKMELLMASLTSS